MSEHDKTNLYKDIAYGMLKLVGLLSSVRDEIEREQANKLLPHISKYIPDYNPLSSY
jgi:hypothetical protein